MAKRADKCKNGDHIVGANFNPTEFDQLCKLQELLSSQTGARQSRSTTLRWATHKAFRDMVLEQSTKK
jgi:hypothetical protein